MVQVRRLGERGAAAVEMAIVLPLLVLLISGVIDFGRFFMANAILTNAASEGTRYAVVTEDPSDPAQQTTIKARAEAAAVNVQTVAGNSIVPTAAFNDNCSSAPPQMSVSVTTKFNWLLVNALPGISNPKTLTSTSVIGCK